LSKTEVDNMPKAIAMSPVHLAEWKRVLADCRICTVPDLYGSVNGDPEIISRPTLAKAFRGEAISPKSWERIFQELELDRVDFFSDAEWNKWDAATLWGMLLKQAQDGSDRLGWVHTKKVQLANFRPIATEAQQVRYLRQIRSGTEVLFEIPSGLNGYFVAIEQDHEGNIYLIAPSPVMKNIVLSGKKALLPQRPLDEKTSKVFKMIELGTRHVWAAVFPELPDLEWLTGAAASRNWQDLNEGHLNDLWEYVESGSSNTPIWRLSYAVTA
jgi:hypothetical protein